MRIPGRFRWTGDDREIFALALPALGALVAEPLYVLADTAVVGNLGTPQLGGLAVASSLLLIAYAVFIFLAYGTTATVARLLGAGHPRRAAHEAVQSLWLALAIGVGVAVVGAATAEPLVRLMGASGDVERFALTYFRISLLGQPAVMVTLAGVGYLRGLKDTRRPLYVAVGTALLNLVVEVVLIFGLGFGIGASAASTVLAQTVAASVYVLWIRAAVAEHGVALQPDPGSLRRLAGDGIDLFWRTVALRGALTVTVAVAARIGDDDLAAHQIAFEIWGLLALTLDAVAIAAQALIGQELGAGRAARARELGRRMIGWGFVVGLGLGATTLLVSPWLGRIFSNDDEVLALTAFLLLLAAVIQPLNGVVFALDGILIGAGDLRYLAVAMWLASSVLIVGALVVLRLDAGIGALWACLHAWIAARMVTLLWRFRSTAWQRTGASLAR